MDGKRIQCLSNASQHVPSIFNRFPVIQPVSSKVRHFSTCFAHFGLPVRPWDNRGKLYMDRKRIRCWPKASQHIPIYLQPFTSDSEILVGNCNFFLQGGAKNGATLSHCKYSENSMTELRGNWRSCAILYAEHCH